MNRAIFLDRDNTLIHADNDMGDPGQVRLIQGAASAIASLRGLGYRIIVVSNQPGVAQGRLSEAQVEAVNTRLSELIYETSGATIDRFYYCPYHPQGTVDKYRGEHPWRKPQPGMLLQAAGDLGLDLAQSWMIGDHLRDVQAGAAAGTRTILLTPQAIASQPPLLQDRAAAEVLARDGEIPAVMPGFIAKNLIEAARIVAQQRRPEGLEDWRSVEPPTKPRPAAPSTGTPASTTPGAALSRKAGVAPSTDPPLAPPAAAVTSPTSAAPVAAHAPASASTTVPKPTALDEAVPAEKAASTGPAPAPPAAVAPSTSHSPPPPTERSAVAGGTSALNEPLLRQILQELRSQRRVGDEFNYLHMVAIVMQVLALVCLAAGLWMGRSDWDLFTRWLGTSLVVQLATIALLLMRK